MPLSGKVIDTMMYLALGIFIGYGVARIERQIKLRRASKMLKKNLDIQQDYYEREKNE